jgi:predicted fused transcriptional regulator/phosphomethylpyrimidine kinase/predicted transcriptional regulator
MRFPCEFIASTFLPGLRIRIAHQLKERGKSQNEISLLLGVKQPVIASYLQKTISDTGDEKFNHHLDSLSETISNMILSQEKLEDTMRTICTKCKSLRVRGPICSFHKTILPELANYDNCDICSGFDSLPSLEKRSQVLLSLKEIFAELENIEGFYEWVPEIGSQLVSCDEDAKELDDVASFPGRIIKVKGSIITVSPPEFGSSKTMSSLLLWIRQFQPDTKWIIGIKNKPKLAKILKSENIRFKEIKELDKKWDECLEEIRKTENITEMKGILDKGSLGYESIAYLIANNETDLLNIVKRISK